MASILDQHRNPRPQTPRPPRGLPESHEHRCAACGGYWDDRNPDGHTCPREED